jgi:hypothetical protein
MSKGSRQRPTDRERYERGYGLVFGRTCERCGGRDRAVEIGFRTCEACQPAEVRALAERLAETFPPLDAP